jgi:hypothetical protein
MFHARASAEVNREGLQELRPISQSETFRWWSATAKATASRSLSFEWSQES